MRELKWNWNITEGRVRLLVRDDGSGIDPQLLRSGREGHFGLPGMRERAERIGAQLRVSSCMTIGTEVELTAPGHTALRASSERHCTGLPGCGHEDRARSPERNRELRRQRSEEITTGESPLPNPRRKACYVRAADPSSKRPTTKALSNYYESQGFAFPFQIILLRWMCFSKHTKEM